MPDNICMTPFRTCKLHPGKTPKTCDHLSSRLRKECPVQFGDFHSPLRYQQLARSRRKAAQNRSPNSKRIVPKYTTTPDTISTANLNQTAQLGGKATLTKETAKIMNTVPATGGYRACK